VVDTSGEGLDVVEALVAEPHGYAEGARSVMAQDYDMSVGIKLLMGAGGDFSHGHQQAVGQAGSLIFPGFTNVEKERRIWLLTLSDELFCGDFRFQHSYKDSLFLRIGARND
jgi:hypothetical protein